MKKKLANLLLALIACLFAAFGFVACGENPLAVSAPTNVRVDAGTMSVAWDKVEGAAKYTISINDGTEYSITNTSYACSQLIQGQQTFTVKVCAVSSVGDMKSEATVMTFSPLDKITDLALSKDDGALTWSVVNNATGYAIRIDGVEQQVPLAVTEYAIDTTGKHSYQVRPVGADNSFYSLWSDVQQVTKLGTVDSAKIKYDVEKGKLSWSSVSNATAYDVYVNGFIETENCTATSVDFDSPNANFVVEIRAKSSSNNVLTGEKSEQKEFIFLDPVTNVRVDDGVLMWDEVELATSYLLKIGNATPKTITGTSYDKLQRGTSLNVSIMPMSDDAVYFSNWSQPMSFYLLEAPIIQWNSSLMLDDGSAKNNIYWDGISNAHGYELKITAPNGDESIEPAVETSRQFEYDFLEVGTYTVELKATADPSDSTFCDSPYSTPIKVTRLASPTQVSSGFITSNRQELSKGFTVSFEKVAKATGYRLYKEETAIMNTTSSTSQFKVTDVAEAGVTSEKIYNYSVQSIGTDSMQNNTVVLSSLKAKSLSFAITVLATPQGPTLDDHEKPTIEGFLYKFGSVEKANGYAVFTGTSVHDSNSTEFDLGVVLKAGPTEVKVCAKGNGANVLASNYSAPINVNRLARPYNIRMDESGSNSVLTCAPIANADSYNAYFDANKTLLTSTQLENIRKEISPKGTGIYMEAVANRFGEDGTYYMTSEASETVTFVKLEAPDFGNNPFTNTEFIWNKPGNINEAIYSPTYAVFDDTGAQYEETMSGTSMSITNLLGGRDYTFTVKAIGGVSANGKTVYINSDLSDVRTIFKIAAPKIEIVNNQYQWNGVARAASYAIYIDGEEKDTYKLNNSGVYTFKPSFEDKKDYTVEVVAIGDGTNTINSSRESDKNYIIQKTAVLTSPDFSVAYSHTTVHDQGEIIVTITRETPYANGYHYTIGGTVQSGAFTTATKEEKNPGVHSVKVYALGGCFDEEGVYYLKSPDQGGNADSKYNITLLAAPTEEDMTYYKTSRTFVFGGVNNANYGYTVKISVNNGEWITISTGTSKTISIGEYINDSTTVVKLSVQANGNGSNVIASKETIFEQSFVQN